MKSFAEHIFLSGLLFLSLLSCEGTVDNGDGDATGDLVLSADKTTVAADGSSVITFTVKCADEDVSTAGRMQIGVAETGGNEAKSWLPAGQNTFSALTAGKYEVSAVYTDADRNKYTSNKVEITLTDAGVLPPSFAGTMLFTQFTSVGCGNCPAMTESLATVQKERPGVLIPVALHIPYDSMIKDPMATTMGSSIAKRFDVTGLPTGFVNYSKELAASSKISEINSALDNALAGTLKPCGIALSSSYDSESGWAEVDLKVIPSERGYYRYLIFLIEDGISYYQLDFSQDTETGTEYIHNRVVRKVLSTNERGEKLNEGLVPLPWVEVAGSKSASIDDEWVVSNMSVVAAVLYAENAEDDYYCLNVAQCALGESLDYTLYDY